MKNLLHEHFFSLQELQLRLSYMWLWAAMGPELLSQQFSTAGGRYPVCLPQEPERKAAAWTKGKPAELWWEPGSSEAYEWGGSPLYFRECCIVNDSNSSLTIKLKLISAILRINQPKGLNEINPCSSAGIDFQMAQCVVLTANPAGYIYQLMQSASSLL